MENTHDVDYYYDIASIHIHYLYTRALSQLFFDVNRRTPHAPPPPAARRMRRRRLPPAARCPSFLRFFFWPIFLLHRF